MFWRKFKMDWPYAFGELFIVTIGVLIALAFGEWNSDRLERAEEFDVLSRLISDIEMDVEGFGARLFRGMTNGYRGRAVDLIARLKEYQSEIR